MRTVESAGGEVLDFGAPILFQGKAIGQVHLGIYEAPLARVANLAFVLLAILTLVTVAAVALGTYLLARRLVGADQGAPRARSTNSRTAATTCASARSARTSSASSTPRSTRPPNRSRHGTIRRPPPPAPPPRATRP